MQLHIKLPKITDFYLTISRTNPVRQEIREVERSNSPQRLEEEQMKDNLDRINMWIGNCDQKASFLLAFLGVAATIFITSNVVSKIKEILITPFVAFWRDGTGSFSIFRLLIAISLIVGSACILAALVHLLFCLMAKTDYSKFHQPGMEERSLLFYVHIASMNYSEYSRAENDRYNDLRSQTYTNACICTEKFKHYRVALHLVLVALPFLTTAFLLILFV